jgi:protein deglycase
MPKLAVVFVDGYEEIEAISVVDILRRAHVEVDMLGFESLSIVGSHGIEVKVDRLLSEVEAKNYDGVILPGGLPGSYTLRDEKDIQGFIRGFEGKLLAAICAAPIALQQAGLLEGRYMTSHPSMREMFDPEYYQEKVVVVDKGLVTSRGAGTSFEFAAGILKTLGLEEKVEELRKAMLYPELRG